MYFLASFKQTIIKIQYSTIKKKEKQTHSVFYRLKNIIFKNIACINTLRIEVVFSFQLLIKSYLIPNKKRNNFLNGKSKYL